MSLFRIWLLMILLVTIWLDESHLMRLKRNKTREREALRQSEKLSRNLGLNEARTEKEIKIDEKLDKIRVRDDSKEDVASEDESDDDDDDEEDEEDERDTSGKDKARREDKVGKGPKIWDQWSKWSPCSVTCGIGKITRWRHCISGGCAPGEKEAQIKTCTLPPC